MRPAEKPVSHEKMLEILSKRTNKPVNGGSAEQSSQALPNDAKSSATPAALEWQRPVRTGVLTGYMLSACGRYSVTRDSVGTAIMYNAFRRATNRYPAPVPLGAVMTREEAQGLCQADLDAQTPSV